MLTQNAVFVLGAGANVPYGFSTGGGLIDKLRSADPQSRMGNAGQQITRQESEAFRIALLDNLLPSIDAMLEHRADLVKVGKRMIATVLYEQEAAASPKSFDDDWMSLIFASMATDAPDLASFASNPVSFVTFNYDRYLEHRFIRGLMARYNVNPRQAWEAVKPMFVHLYGSLGDLPEQGSAARNALIVPLGAPETDDTYNLGLALQASEQMITIVHDTDQPPQTFTEALRRFQTARRCVFLGFGFGKKNVERLQTVRIPQNATIDCTTYGMTGAEIMDSIIPAFPGRELSGLRRQVKADYSDKRSINQFLRENIGLLR
jgi:hypothetical protein